MKIGLFGGTFNPVHSGHVLIAEWIRCELFLDTIYFIPTAVPPHRSDDSSIAAIAHRLEMVRRAVQDNPSFEVSEIESNPDIMSYTADTVQSFHETYSLSRENIFYIIGSDNCSQIAAWKYPEKLASLCRIAIARRSSFHVDAIPENLNNPVVVNTPLIEVSASDVRQRIANNKSVRYMVPAEVEKYMHTHNLYRPVQGR